MNLKSVLNLFYFVFILYCYVKYKGKIWRQDQRTRDKDRMKFSGCLGKQPSKADKARVST